MLDIFPILPYFCVVGRADMKTTLISESSELEYKREIPDDNRKWLKTVIAFANGKGGQIIFGIDDETHMVVGVDVDNIARTVDRITEIIVKNCTPQIIPDVRIDTMAGKYVIVVDIRPGQNTPYYLSKYGMEEGTYVRVAASTRLAESHVRMELLLRSRGLTYDQHTDSRLSPATDEEIQQLCDSITSRNSKKIMVTREHLISWGIVSPDENGKLHPTVTFCLFARPHCIHFSRIQCAVFLSHDRSRFLDSTELTGPVHLMAEDAINYVLRNTRVEYKIDGFYRDEVHEIPLPALREIVVNAILHPNYLSPAFIQIAIHPDRIEFFSPGALHGSMTKERMLQGNSSSLRNPLLADILHRMNVVERWGSGIARIYASCKEMGMRLPEYQIDDMGVTVTVYRPVSDNSIKPISEKFEPVVISPKVHKVSDNELLEFIRQHPNCAYSLILQTFDVSRRTLSNKLSRLMEQGKIQRIGSARNARWNAL